MQARNCLHDHAGFGPHSHRHRLLGILSISSDVTIRFDTASFPDRYARANTDTLPCPNRYAHVNTTPCRPNRHAHVNNNATLCPN